MKASRSIPVTFTMNRCHEWECAYGTACGRSIPGTPESPAKYRRASSARRAFSPATLRIWTTPTAAWRSVRLYLYPGSRMS